MRVDGLGQICKKNVSSEGNVTPNTENKGIGKRTLTHSITHSLTLILTLSPSLTLTHGGRRLLRRGMSFNSLFIHFIFVYYSCIYFFNLQWQETAQTRHTFSDQCAPRLNQMPYSGPGLRLAARCVCVWHARTPALLRHTHACMHSRICSLSHGLWVCMRAHTHACTHVLAHTYSYTCKFVFLRVHLMCVIFYFGGSMQDAVPAVSDGRKGRGQDTQKFLYPGQPAQVNLDFRYTRAQAHTHTRAHTHTHTRRMRAG
jgi:hypothetical protein